MEKLLELVIIALFLIAFAIMLINVGKFRVIVENPDNSWKQELFRLVYKMFTTRKENVEVNVVDAMLSLNETGKEIAQAIRNHTVYISTTGKKDQ
jgi:hypothetical protein